MNKLKIFNRRVKDSLVRRLGLNKQKFFANQLRLSQAQNEGEELIDVMPGINLPMVIHSQMYFIRAYTQYTFEPASLYFIRDYLQPGQTVLDVGANVGYFSLLFAQIVGEKGRVIAFEPGEFAYSLLKRNCELNQFDCLETYQAGLGEKDAIVTFNSGKPGMDVYNSLGEICHPSADVAKFETTKIQIFRGDQWLMDHHVEYIHFMKLDVEGGEYQVLQGMQKIFEEKKVLRLLIEITYEMSKAFGYAPSDIISLLRSCGYDWFELKPGGNLIPLTNNVPQNSGMFVAVAQS